MKNFKAFSVFFVILLLFCSSCKNKKKKETKTEVHKTETKTEEGLQAKNFDTLIDGDQVKLYWLKNNHIKAAFTNYGGRVVGLWVPDKNGKFTDVVAGLSSTKAYINSSSPYFGAIIGRVGNRIAKGKFTIDHKDYQIPTNNHGNTLHGGPKGFHAVVWDAKKTNEHTLVFTYNSPAMEEGFPGNLDVKVTYTLTNDKSLKIAYKATTDKTTPVNLTNHSYFNLNGEGSGTIVDHKFRFYSDKFTPVKKGLIPTGKLKSVKGTPFDFTDFHTLRKRIKTDNEQLELGHGYDMNFVLNGTKAKGMDHAATVIGDKSGIKMDIYTDQPGLQFYSGNFMKSQNTFKSGTKDDFRTAFAIETQHFPDAPNQPNFPSINLKPSETYYTISEYQFSLTKEHE